MANDKRIHVPGGIMTARSAELAAELLADAIATEPLVRERWSTDRGEQMRRLCASFPGLADVPGTDPWDVATFLAWACGPEPSAGALHAARFVLSVWNPGVDWASAAADADLAGAAGLTPFHLMGAWSSWDQAHRDAALDWLELPFFPWA